MSREEEEEKVNTFGFLQNRCRSQAMNIFIIASAQNKGPIACIGLRSNSSLAGSSGLHHCSTLRLESGSTRSCCHPEEKKHHHVNTRIYPDLYNPSRLMGVKALLLNFWRGARSSPTDFLVGRRRGVLAPSMHLCSTP